jgi:Trk K+ transport system NAD-binding subunit
VRVVVVGCGRVGAARADTLVAATSGDISNVVAARAGQGRRRPLGAHTPTG